MGEDHVPYADPGHPPRLGPLRLLTWLAVRQRGRIARGAMWGTLWMLGLMLPPYLVSRAIDDGLRARVPSALFAWVGAVVVIGAVNAASAIMRHRTMTYVRADAAYRTVQVVVRHITRLGAAFPRRVSTGELTSVQSSDIWNIAESLTLTGPGVGAVLAYLATAVLLFTISPLLAVIVLVGVPALGLAILPMLRRLRVVEGSYRAEQGALAARAGDIVSGLRVLCGIGGKPLFAERYRTGSRSVVERGYRVGEVTSWVHALAACLPVLYLAAVTWVAARLAAAGTISVGQLVAVYGYVAMLVVPVMFLVDGAAQLTRGLVAAGRVVRILALEPDVADGADGADLVAGPAATADLVEPESGLVARGGALTALVSAAPADAIDLVDRLGRFADSDATWGSVRLADMAIAEVRARILVCDNDAHLFAGSVRDTVTTVPRSPEALAAAVRAAAANDIVDGLPNGLDSLVEARGRDLSGGQRQRVRLVRALLAEPDVLLLVEPTSAVDTHTEAAVVRGVATARRGRTTLVVSTSPLVLDRADEVVFLVDGKVTATGAHAELLATEPAYRSLVLR
ncbi:ABC transporter ATP-binding protein [Actinokineospora sp. NBRC 105648]|uniref:ABC transporter ATP-binding protein n=1 Tax=Actinokineospora sp. NBRC 105648 TaxID=3032206 RepID=UPI0024A2A398|nr:ABC transporter ATP-binding protein [Actinokineospora sp. NBRC 105648]GLZ43367.1 ABC transporter [Actinokineospora sp. NBRC 105648]